MSFICSICNKNYASRNSLSNHNRKKHNSNIVNNIIIKTFSCKYCSKIYNNKYSKYKHQKPCKEKYELIQDTQEKNNLIITKLDNIENKLHNKNIKNNNLTNSNNLNNINYGTINHININKIGSADMTCLTDENINDIFSKEIDCIFTFVELLHFNKNIPENHNHCTTNLSSKYLSVYNSDTKKIEKDRKKYIFDTILSKSIDLMDLLFSKNKSKFNSKRKNEITQTIETLKNLRLCYDNKKLFNEFINKLDLMSYNNRKVIIDTWSNKNIQNDSDSDDLAKDLENTTMEELLLERERRANLNNPVLNYLDNDSEDDKIWVKIKNNMKSVINIPSDSDD